MPSKTFIVILLQLPWFLGLNTDLSLSLDVVWPFHHFRQGSLRVGLNRGLELLSSVAQSFEDASWKPMDILGLV